MSLSLIPFDELIQELERRSEVLVIAYTVKDPQERDLDWFRYGKGHRGKAVQLAADLLNDVQNNWSGELETLQRLNEDEEE